MKRGHFVSHVAAVSLFWIAAVAGSMIWIAIPVYKEVTHVLVLPYAVAVVVVLCGVLPLANAFIYLLVLRLSGPIAKEHAWRLYTLSVVFGIASLSGWLVIGSRIFDVDQTGWWHFLFLPIAPVISGLISAGGFRIAVALRFLRRPRVDSACAKCGYDLRGSPSPTCPECSTPIDKP